MWKGRFQQSTAELLSRYSESISFDWRLHSYDIQGSIAHSKALLAAGILTAQEQAAIEAWLGLVVAAAVKSAAFALEVAECSRLIKGYGDTLKRGAENYAMVETKVIGPVLAGTIATARGIDAIASARTAALVDPEGESLAKCLAEIGEAREFDIAAE